MNEDLHGNRLSPEQACLIEDQVTGGNFLSVSFLEGTEDILFSTFDKKKPFVSPVRIRSTGGGTHYQAGTSALQVTLCRLRDVFGRYAQPNLKQGALPFLGQSSEIHVPERPDFIIPDDDKNQNDLYVWDVPYLSFYREGDLLGIRSSVRSKRLDHEERFFLKFDHAPVVWLKPKEMPKECSNAVLGFYKEARKYESVAKAIGMTYE